MTPRKSGALVAAVVTLVFLSRSASAASDVVTVGTVTASGSTVDVPVSIRDTSTTPLGMDQPAGSKIQSFSIKVDYSPASAVDSVSFNRAGITANLTPTSEFKPSGSGTVSLLDTFQESTNQIPFTLDASAPGNLVAHLVFNLSSSATPGTSISISLDSTLTQLTDSGGTAATKETVGNGSLVLVNGAINIAALTVSLTPPARTVPLGRTASLAVVISSQATGPVTVNLSSSDTAVARVPSSVVIPAGTNAAEFNVSGIALGTATITASLAGGSSTATAGITVADVPLPCTTPTVPVLSAPASADVGAAYTVSWTAVNGATDYFLDEATDQAFATATTQTVTTTSVSFTHTTGSTRYYYRLRARNYSGACNVFSDFSPTISVLINAAPAPAMRVLAVAGSVQGSFGSFFKTSVQLYNPKNVSVSGRLVYHPAGASASAGDPSLSFSLAPGKTVSYADLLPAMGVASGVGSVDLIADQTSPLPVVLVRVFNDAGSAGTTGLAEEAMSPDDALRAGTGGVLIAPPDVQRFRLNIGIRSLEQGAALTITVRDRDGLVVKTVPKSFGPSFFQQITSAQMLDGYVLAGGETITFDLASGSAFVYGATTDNTTNDPSVQFARRIE
jgi:hypothetical protein